MLPEIHQEIRSRKQISGHAARICVQNFGAVLDMVVKFAGDLIFVLLLPGYIKTYSKTPIKHKEHVGVSQDAFSEKVPVHWEGPGPGPLVSVIS